MKTLFRLCFIGCMLVGLSSCQNKTPAPITEADMEKFINENIPLGAPSSDVLAYLKTLKFGSRSLIGVDYNYGRFDSISVEDSQPPNVHSHIRASLPDAYTQGKGIIPTDYWLRMAFYFDANEKLIGHSIYSLANR
jgi:hypothetical protein